MAVTTRETSIERLSDKEVRAWLKAPGTEALHDGGGLYLRRGAAGAFWVLRQVDPLTGKRSWASLFPGVPYPDVTLASARQSAAQARMRAADRTTSIPMERAAAVAKLRADAAAVALEQLRQVTVKDLFERWVSTELVPRIGTDGKRTGRKDGGQYTREQFERRVFPSLGAVHAPSIRKSDLLAILDGTKADGRLRTANVLLADLKQMFRFALTREIVERNPLDTVSKRDVGGKETERDRVLTADEVAALARAVPLARMSKRSELAIWLILATGCRVGEAMAGRWEHVDRQAGTWHLPTTKNERDHTIHLSAFAMRQIQALAALRENGKDGKPVPWVFPNSAADGPVCVKSFGKQLADRQREPARRLSHRSLNTKTLCLPGGKWTAHDLRRTAATMMAELGISGDVIDECLNHMIESRVRRTYIRDRRLTDQARAFDALGTRLAVLVDGGGASNVVQLRAA